MDVAEPFSGLFTQGMVVHETFERETPEGQPNVFFEPTEVALEGSGPGSSNGRRAVLKETGEELRIGPLEKMSKSKRNVVSPEAITATYGADTARWFMLSDSPPDRDVEWTDAGAEGAHRFVQRLWRLLVALPPIANEPVGDGLSDPCRRHPQGRAPSRGAGGRDDRDPALQQRHRHGPFARQHDRNGAAQDLRSTRTRITRRWRKPDRF